MFGVRKRFQSVSKTSKQVRHQILDLYNYYDKLDNKLNIHFAYDDWKVVYVIHISQQVCSIFFVHPLWHRMLVCM